MLRCTLFWVRRRTDQLWISPVKFLRAAPFASLVGRNSAIGSMPHGMGELLGHISREGLMPQPVMAILAHQYEMSERARSRLGDVNEAGLVVSTVLGRAIRRSRQRDDYRIDVELWRDFEETLRRRFS